MPNRNWWSARYNEGLLGGSHGEKLQGFAVSGFAVSVRVDDRYTYDKNGFAAATNMGDFEVAQQSKLACERLLTTRLQQLNELKWCVDPESGLEHIAGTGCA